jgi:hypothetical protein
MDCPDFRSDAPSLGERVPLDQVAVHLHPLDNVVIAKVDLPAGITLLLPDRADIAPSRTLHLRQAIPSAHKVALRLIAAGEPVLRYGQEIGRARTAIRPGEHVHTHNLGVEELESRRAHDMRPLDAAEVRPMSHLPQAERRTFL